MSLANRIHRILSHWSAGVVLCGGAVFLAEPVNAATITQSAGFGSGGTLSVPLADLGTQPFGTDLTGSRSSSGQVTFQRFNSALGTLTGATWELVGASYSFDLFHRAEVTHSIGTIRDFSMRAQADGVGHVGGISLLGLNNQSFNLATGQTHGCDLHNDIDLPGNPGCGLDTLGRNDVLFDSLAANVAAFLGIGSFNEEIEADISWNDRIDVGGFGQAPTLGPRPADVAGRFDFAGELRLVYTYTPTTTGHVPEPGTLWLAVGLLPLAWRLRRRAAR